MDGRATAGGAAVLEHGISEGTDLLQRETGTLRAEADPSFVDVAVKAKAAGRALVFSPGFNGHKLILANADDMVAAIVEG